MSTLTSARAGTADDAVGGVVPAEVVRPRSAQEVAELLRSTSTAVVPVGSGSKTGWAAPPSALDTLLDLRGLDRVVEHVAGDLVVIAEAGVALGALQERLAEHGQLLGLDPPEPDATLGGIVSANASGPRRLRYGTVRDLLIGVTVVLADGTVASSGGKVVKNVAGYDLGKLYTGAHGSLGVVVSTTWRLHPLPKATGALVVPVQDAADAGRLAQLLVRSTLTPSAVELAWPQRELVVLFESIPESVHAQSEQALRLLGAGARTEELPGWFGQRPVADAGDEVVLRIAYEPYALPAVLDALPGRATASVCTGVAYAVAPAAEVARIRSAIAPYDGTAVLVGGSGADHWGPLPDSFALMQRVKERFDPRRRLSPGRLLGGI